MGPYRRQFPLKGVFFRRKNMNSNDYVHCCVTVCHGNSLLHLVLFSCEGLLVGGDLKYFATSMFMQSSTVKLHRWWPCRVGSVGSTVSREFASRPGHTKDHHKNGTNCLPAWHAMCYGRSLEVQPNCLKGWVVCGIVYGEMHLKDLLGSFVRVGYHIPFPYFYLVLHGLRCRKSTIMD